MKATLRAGSAIAVLALVAVAVALLVSRISGSGTRNSEARKRAVITAAMKASGFGMHMLPRTEGTRTCTVHGGGPAPGVSFGGAICKTRVVAGRQGITSVYFTHVIQGGAHTWLYRVSPSLHVRFVHDFGPGIAPEYWA